MSDNKPKVPATGLLEISISGGENLQGHLVGQLLFDKDNPFTAEILQVTSAPAIIKIEDTNQDSVNKELHQKYENYDSEETTDPCSEQYSSPRTSVLTLKTNQENDEELCYFNYVKKGLKTSPIQALSYPNGKVHCNSCFECLRGDCDNREEYFPSVSTSGPESSCIWQNLHHNINPSSKNKRMAAGATLNENDDSRFNESCSNSYTPSQSNRKEIDNCSLEYKDCPVYQDLSLNFELIEDANISQRPITPIRQNYCQQSGPRVARQYTKHQNLGGSYTGECCERRECEERNLLRPSGHPDGLQYPFKCIKSYNCCPSAWNPALESQQPIGFSGNWDYKFHCDENFGRQKQRCNIDQGYCNYNEVNDQKEYKRISRPSEYFYLQQSPCQLQALVHDDGRKGFRDAECFHHPMIRDMSRSRCRNDQLYKTEIRHDNRLYSMPININPWRSESQTQNNIPVGKNPTFSQENLKSTQYSKARSVTSSPEGQFDPTESEYNKHSNKYPPHKIYQGKTDFQEKNVFENNSSLSKYAQENGPQERQTAGANTTPSPKHSHFVKIPALEGSDLLNVSQMSGLSGEGLLTEEELIRLHGNAMRSTQPIPCPATSDQSTNSRSFGILSPSQMRGVSGEGILTEEELRNRFVRQPVRQDRQSDTSSLGILSPRQMRGVSGEGILTEEELRNRFVRQPLGQDRQSEASSLGILSPSQMRGVSGEGILTEEELNSRLWRPPVSSLPMRGDRTSDSRIHGILDIGELRRLSGEEPEEFNVEKYTQHSKTRTVDKQLSGAIDVIEQENKDSIQVIPVDYMLNTPYNPFEDTINSDFTFSDISGLETPDATTTNLGFFRQSAGHSTFPCSASNVENVCKLEINSKIPLENDPPQNAKWSNDNYQSSTSQSNGLSACKQNVLQRPNFKDLFPKISHSFNQPQSALLSIKSTHSNSCSKPFSPIVNQERTIGRKLQTNGPGYVDSAQFQFNASEFSYPTFPLQIGRDKNFSSAMTAGSDLSFTDKCLNSKSHNPIENKYPPNNLNSNVPTSYYEMQEHRPNKYGGTNEDAHLYPSKNLPYPNIYEHIATGKYLWNDIPQYFNGVSAKFTENYGESKTANVGCQRACANNSTILKENEILLNDGCFTEEADNNAKFGSKCDVNENNENDDQVDRECLRQGRSQNTEYDYHKAEPEESVKPKVVEE